MPFAPSSIALWYRYSGVGYLSEDIWVSSGISRSTQGGVLDETGNDWTPVLQNHTASGDSRHSSVELMIAALQGAHDPFVPASTPCPAQGEQKAWCRKRARSDAYLDTTDNSTAPDDTADARDQTQLQRRPDECSPEAQCTIDDMDAYLSTPLTADVMAAS